MENEERKETIEDVLNDSSLTEKERLFCLEYLGHFNATKAYADVYGSERKYAKQAAHIMLKKPKIKEYIEKLREFILEDSFVDKKAIIQRHIDIAFADLKDFAKWGVKTRKDSKGNEYQVSYVELKDSEDVDGSLIDTVMGGKAAMIKLVDKQKSLDALNKIFKVVDEDTSKEFRLVIKSADEDE